MHNFGEKLYLLLIKCGLKKNGMCDISTIVTANFSFTMVLMSHISYIFSPRGCTANIKCPKLCGRQSELHHIRIICHIPPWKFPEKICWNH